MGFGLQYQIVNGQPVLFEVLHESQDAIVSVIISGSTGAKLQAITYDKSKVDKTLYSNVLQFTGDELYPNSIKAIIPIRVGDVITITTLQRADNHISTFCCPIWFIDGSCASGPANDVNFHLEKSMFDLTRNVNNISDDSFYNSSTALISIFNVMNPRHALSYHLDPV
jgi:hypothetical protein